MVQSATGACDHVLQFYETDEFLVDVVGKFIGAGLRTGETGVVLCTSAHQAVLEERFLLDGLDLPRLCAGGRYIVLDAAEALSACLVDGKPDANRFAAVVGDVVIGAVDGGSPVRVFGELVALLATEGNYQAALRLEALWNALQRSCDFTLLCGYRMDDFGGDSSVNLLNEICAAHSHVMPTESYAALAEPEERLRAVVALQQKATSLEAEIAQRRATEAMLAGQNRVLAMIAVGTPLAEVLAALALMIEEQAGDGLLCSVLVRDPQAEQFTLGVAPNLPFDYIDALAHAPISPPYLGPCGRVAHRGEEVATVDIAVDERWAEVWRELAMSHGLRTCYSSPIIASDGRVLGAVAIYYRRPNHPQPANQQLLETATYLASIAIEQRQVEFDWRTSEELTQRVLDSSADSIKLLDLDGNVLYMSPASQRLLEIDDLSAHLHHSWLDLWNSADRERAREAISVAREGRIVTFEGFRPTAKGTPKWWDVLISPIHDLDGQPAQLLAISRDITERKLSEDALVEARFSAEQAARAREEFLSIASHELRNPVTTLSGTAQLMRRAWERGRLTDERLGIYLGSLERAGNHLAVLTNDLLDVSRLQRGEFPIRPEPVDVAGLLRDIVRRNEWPGHFVLLEGADERIDALIDIDRIRQVIVNLLSNAVKYSPAADEVLLRLLSSSSGFQIEVQDFGIGLPAEFLEAIFTPFQRAPNASRAGIPGLGLGLFIARRIAEQHGGRLWASSEGDGRGTVMSLWLPVRRDDVEEHSTSEAADA